LADLAQVLLQNLDSAQLLLLVLDDGLRGYHLLWDSRGNEHKVLFTNLDSALFCIELADTDAFAHLPELELLWLVARELDHVKPRDGRAVLAMALEDAWRAIKEALESLDKNGTQRPCAQVTGHGLMAVEDALVVAEEGEDVGKCIVISNQWQVCVQVSDEVVDLEMVVRLGGFGVWRCCVHILMRGAALALEISRSRLGWMGVRHVEVDDSVRVVAGHGAPTEAERGGGKLVWWRADGGRSGCAADGRWAETQAECSDVS
jgi:hypothetical protein